MMMIVVVMMIMMTVSVDHTVTIVVSSVVGAVAFIAFISAFQFYR